MQGPQGIVDVSIEVVTPISLIVKISKFYISCILDRSLI
jgi:hypothetical protein